MYFIDLASKFTSMAGNIHLGTSVCGPMPTILHRCPSGAYRCARTRAALTATMESEAELVEAHEDILTGRNGLERPRVGSGAIRLRTFSTA
jgi:hypothetical protein